MTEPITGAASLGADLRRRLGGRHPVAAVAVVNRSGTTTAALGAELNDDFEIGSVSKAITGLLYADALTRGEVRRTSPLGEFLELGDSPAAGVDLDAVSKHRSGLPRLPSSAQPFRKTIALWHHGANPYGEDLPELLVQARGVKLGKPRFAYSNLGFELLGHAVASAVGSTYADLVRTRIVEPLGLHDTYVPAAPEELRPGAVDGHSKRGRAMQPWTGAALGPAGGIRSSIRDLGTLVAALLDGTAPGLGALEPAAPMGGRAHIGAGWVILGADREHPVVWHNGGTGGFRSWLGLDRVSGAGVAVVTATSASVDRHGFALLTGQRAASD